MKSLSDISAELSNLADYVGGDHFTNKEIESKLNDISKELYDTAYEIRKITDPKSVNEFIGIRDDIYRILQREENIKKNEQARNEI